ncbi:MAG: dihydroorotase, partial [Clostridia bacterium]|nr:dihydroorotase [Clostridia bacterium]
MISVELFIKGARLIDPSCGIDDILDIVAAEGKIKEIGKGLTSKGQVIEGEGLVVCPGFVDMHTHMRDPGLIYKEDLTSGSRAAAAGGVTTLLAMPNTAPPIDSPKRLGEAKINEGKKACVHVVQAAAMTIGQEGKELCDYQGLQKAGCVALSDDGKAVADGGTMREVLQEAKKYNLLPIAHCDDVSLIRGGAMNEGETAKALGVKGNPAVAEEVIIARDILLAQSVDYRVHIAHVSSGRSVQLIREAKARGAYVTCETAPHYISLTDEVVAQKGTDAKMNPPLRSRRDVSELIAGIKDGTIDAIATDHAPHSKENKAGGLLKAASGIVGLETMLGVCMKYLVTPGHITLNRLIELISTSPARILGVPGGTLKVGAPADITLFAPDEAYRVDRERFFSKGRNTPYDGET